MQGSPMLVGGRAGSQLSEVGAQHGLSQGETDELERHGCLLPSGFLVVLYLGMQRVSIRGSFRNAFVVCFIR